MERTTTWWSALWARWLGWTVVFGLVFIGSGWLSILLPFPVRAIVFFVLLLVAAFLIGLRFRSLWWTAGPAAALLTLSTYRETPFSLGDFLISALCAVLAWAGIMWGRLREYEAAFRDGGLADDDWRSGQS
jgi:hypothetical protein